MSDQNQNTKRSQERPHACDIGTPTNEPTAPLLFDYVKSQLEHHAEDPALHVALRVFMREVVEQGSLYLLRLIEEGLEHFLKNFGTEKDQEVLHQIAVALKDKPQEEVELRAVLLFVLRGDDNDTKVATFLSMGVAAYMDDIRAKNNYEPEGEEAARRVQNTIEEVRKEAAKPNAQVQKETEVQDGFYPQGLRPPILIVTVQGETPVDSGQGTMPPAGRDD
jgi:hypothetical protein